MITINGEPYKGNYRNTDELFTLICSKLDNRPEECALGGIVNKKQKMREEYEKEWGKEGTPERAIIIMEKLKD